MFQALKKSVRSLAICSLAIVSSLSSAYADEANTNAQGKTLNIMGGLNFSQSLLIHFVKSIKFDIMTK